MKSVAQTQKFKAVQRLAAFLLIVTMLVSYQNCALGIYGSDASDSNIPLGSNAYTTGTSTITNPATSQTLSFALLNSGATLSLDVSSNGSTYTFANLSVSVGSSSLQFSGLRIWINGVEVNDSTFGSDTGVLPGGTFGNFSGPSITVAPVMAPAAGDTVAVSFKSLAIAGQAIGTSSPASSSGAALYANACASCHGPLSSSDRHGATVSQIQNALGNVGNMNFLRGSLTTTQIQAISQALQL